MILAMDVAGEAVLVVIAAALLGLYIGSIIWAAGDAERRGKSGCLVALLVALVSWPLGLLIWVILRPKAEQ